MSLLVEDDAPVCRFPAAQPEALGYQVLTHDWHDRWIVQLRRLPSAGPNSASCPIGSILLRRHRRPLASLLSASSALMFRGEAPALGIEALRVSQDTLCHGT
jgi:hypothetical protein